MTATRLLALGLLLALGTLLRAQEPAAVQKLPLSEVEAKHLANVRQVTAGFPQAGEGYFSPDGKQIVFQAFPIGYPFYQIFVQPLDSREPRMVSTGRGRTTCSYFSPDAKTILFASSHLDPHVDETELKAREEAAKGGRRRYQWDFDPYMELFTVNANGTGMKRLTDSPGYDAEGSYSHDGKQIVFTSSRDGDPDLYVMNADGSNVRQVVNADGYDGGPFFSPDDKWIIFRSDRLKKDMLQIYIVSVDGKTEVQLSNNLDHVNWCPFFHPSGKYYVWAGADYSRPPGTPGVPPAATAFHLWTQEVAWEGGKPVGGKVTQITDTAAQDVLPVFSPDGKQLMWTSRNRGDRSSQLFIADWVREGARPETR